MKLKLFFGTLSFAFLTIALSTSCEKKTDCKVTIKTIDSAGFGVSNARVKLYANVKNSTGATVEADLKAEGTSDGSGQTTFTFKLPAILDIKAISVMAGDSLQGVGIVKLEEGKSVEKSVTMKGI